MDKNMFYKRREVISDQFEHFDIFFWEKKQGKRASRRGEVISIFTKNCDFLAKTKNVHHSIQPAAVRISQRLQQRNASLIWEFVLYSTTVLYTSKIAFLDQVARIRTNSAKVVITIFHKLGAFTWTNRETLTPSSMFSWNLSSASSGLPPGGPHQTGNCASVGRST